MGLVIATDAAGFAQGELYLDDGESISELDNVVLYSCHLIGTNAMMYFLYVNSGFPTIVKMFL